MHKASIPGALARSAQRETILFTLPAFVLVAMTIYIPFVMSGYYSLAEWNGIAKVPQLVGLANYRQIFSGSPDFVRALLFIGKYTLVFMVVSNLLALATTLT